jgi:DNA uptake protein ComE-like DNA-binding protein
MFLHKLIRQAALLFLPTILLITATACNPGGGNQPTTNGNTASSPTPAGANTNAANSNAPVTKVNINTASEADLLRAIPNLGNRMVHEFQEYRPYRSIQQFRKEIGKYVDRALVAEYEKYIFVPIDENQSDAPTLQQIPGLDAGEAQELIAGRPYASRDAFLAKLAEKVSPEELAIAKTYLVQR